MAKAELLGFFAQLRHKLGKLLEKETLDIEGIPQRKLIHRRY
jgi:hypothetical protein